LADTFDDPQSGHPGRTALSADDARRLIERGRNTQFEASVVDAFLDITRAPEGPPPFVELPVHKLKPGMVLARDLRSREGMVLLVAEHVLSTDLIQRIGVHATRHNLSLLIAVQTPLPDAQL
jgi:hypothetical protein